MKHEEQVRLIEGLMSHLDNDTNVDAGHQVRNPVSSYLSDEMAAREWQEFFQTHPQVIGLSADLPQAESFFTSSELGKPILCTRTKDGSFHAFLNVCRHRGTIVEEEARGCKKRFVCPFHAWAYDHEGKLVGLPKEDHFGSVEREALSLIELPAIEKYGLLFVSPEPDGHFDVDELLGDLAPELESWNLGQCERHDLRRYDHAMNWKLAIDTFGETYHFGSLHRNTLAPFFYGNAQMYDRYGRNHRMILCIKTIDELRTKPKSEWDILQAGFPVYYLFPNIQLLIGQGGPTLVRVYPEGPNPNQSFSQVSFYLNPDSPGAESKEMALLRMESFAQVIRDEDYVAAASQHRGATSGAQDFVLFGRNEPALHHYHDTYRAALGLPLLERI
jgi:phenylpropionate dioxygenase-like ring-hydroxylating dioxygenase large terminal subunit